MMGEMMGKRAQELGILAVKQIKERGIHFVGGVPGLALTVHKGGSRSWVLRYQVAGRRRDLGLGAFDLFSLAQAREAAREARAKIARGIDPINDRRALRSQLIASQIVALTFSQAATKYVESHEASWRNAKHAQQWRNTLESYAYPVLGRMLVRDIDLPHILRVLEPIWQTKTETASRLRGRLESILDWSTVRGERTGPNPARWKGHLDTLLAAPKKITKTVHHRALPVAALPDFMLRLNKQGGTGAAALAFTIFTTARSGEVRAATWPEFNFAAQIWSVPASRMKAGREHRVPLSSAAMAILTRQKSIAINEYVFPSPRATVLSDMSLTAVLRRMEVPAVPHGFRSTFRDWCAESTDFSPEVAEMALAHTIGNKVEAAYRRGDLFEKRKELMQAWADYALPSQRQAA